MGYFFSQLTRSVGVFFRTLRAFFVRRLMGVTTFFRRMLNFSRHATKAAASSLQDVVTAGKNPTSQADYVETGHLFISKALIVRVLLIAIAAGLVIWFVIWPFVLSRFLTARFFVEDKRVADWSGRVIVYADKKKTIPMYAGRLEKGVLQGEGKQYDSEGLLVYEGQLRDGERTGTGKEYQAGILTYEGQFDAGTYNGYGRAYTEGALIYDGQYDKGKRSGSGTAYADNQLLYEGQFMDDLYEGRGKLYRNGVLCYDGSFHAGIREGTGTAYFANGKMAYQGQYLADKKDGIGTVYTESGLKEYVGSFSEDVYSGEGTLYFDDGGQLTGTFDNGVPVGSVEWKKNGLLYYQGEWSDGAPSGFGTLYSKAGKVLYEGPFLGGTIDGRSLLTYTTEELRSALAEGSIKNENDGTAFRIIAEELGLTALCTFQTDKADSQVYQIYLYPPEKSDWVSVLPGAAHTKPVQWPQGEKPDQLKIQFIGQYGVNLPAGPYYAENNVKDDQRTTVLYRDETRKQAALLTWERRDAIPDAGTPGGGSKEDDKVEHLLEAMDTMINHDGIAAGTVAFFGGTKTDEALTSVNNAAEAVTLTDAMLDFWEETQRLLALEEISERNETMLSDAQNAAQKGVGSAEQVYALQEEQLELKAQIETAKTAIKRAELQAEELGVTGLGDYALEELLLSFNLAEQDISGLALFATAYAKATGSETPEAAIESAVKDALLCLSDAYSAEKLALARYQTLEENTENALNAYSMGLGTKDAWLEAQNTQAQARIRLCSAMAEFSRQANRFNQLTGGWVSRSFDWHKDVFEELFRAEILTEDGGEDGEEPASAGEKLSADAPDGEETPAVGAEENGAEVAEEVPAAEAPETPETAEGTEPGAESAAA